MPRGSLKTIQDCEDFIQWPNMAGEAGRHPARAARPGARRAECVDVIQADMGASCAAPAVQATTKRSLKL